MSSKTIFFIILVLAIIAGLFYWLAPFDSGVDMDEPVGDDITDVDPGLNSTMTLSHFFNEGTHVLEGNIDLPTPCHELTTNVVIAESFPEQVTVEFTDESGDEICTQSIFSKIIRVEFDASEEATISATYNGSPVELILNEEGEGNLKL